MDINLKITQNKDAVTRLQEENNIINLTLNEVKEKFNELSSNFINNMEHIKQEQNQLHAGQQKAIKNNN